MRISDWSSDVCSSDLAQPPAAAGPYLQFRPAKNLAKERFGSREFFLHRSLVQPEFQRDLGLRHAVTPSCENQLPPPPGPGVQRLTRTLHLNARECNLLGLLGGESGSPPVDVKGG